MPSRTYFKRYYFGLVAIVLCFLLIGSVINQIETFRSQPVPKKEKETVNVSLYSMIQVDFFFGNLKPYQRVPLSEIYPLD